MWFWIAFIAIGLVGGAICIRSAMIIGEMRAALMSGDPTSPAEDLQPTIDPYKRMRHIRAYAARFPAGDLTAKLRSTYWALAIWFGVGVLFIFGFGS